MRSLGDGVLSHGPGARRDRKPLRGATYYRKALYLDANHYDAQIHLALLMEKQGDSAGAQVLRNRARRLEQKSQASHE